MPGKIKQLSKTILQKIRLLQTSNWETAKKAFNEKAIHLGLDGGQNVHKLRK